MCTENIVFKFKPSTQPENPDMELFLHIIDIIYYAASLHKTFCISFFIFIFLAYSRSSSSGPKAEEESIFPSLHVFYHYWSFQLFLPSPLFQAGYLLVSHQSTYALENKHHKLFTGQR
jgi:hypothetical protein